MLIFFGFVCFIIMWVYFYFDTHVENICKFYNNYFVNKFKIHIPHFKMNYHSSLFYSFLLIILVNWKKRFNEILESEKRGTIRRGGESD